MEILNHPLVEIALRTAVIYAVVLTGLRLMGKREVGQMMPLDLALLLLLANAVQNAMTGSDSSVAGGLVAAVTLFAPEYFINSTLVAPSQNSSFGRGHPTLLIRHGKILPENLQKEKLTGDDLHQVLREHGVASVSEVALAVLEVDGMISVLKNEEMPKVEQPHHRMRVPGKRSAKL